MRSRVLQILEARKQATAAFLSLLIFGTLGIGIYLHEYFVAAVFSIWMLAEVLLRHFDRISRIIPDLRKAALLAPMPSAFSALIDLFESNDVEAEFLIDERLSELTLSPQESAQAKWLESFREIVRLRRLLRELGEERLDLDFAKVSKKGVYLAHLVHRVFLTAKGENRKLKALAEKVLENAFGKSDIDRVTDSIHRHGSVPFFVFRLLQAGKIEEARSMGQWLLTQTDDMEEEIRSSVYWLAELHGFLSEHKGEAMDYEKTIRLLYHLCFTNPERTGFLEIDSPYYSQFETVSEIAQEGLLFKETLIDNLLALWAEYDCGFEAIFRTVLETMTQRKSKIYDSRDAWERFWKRERENFGKAHLYVVEGNICYSAGETADALSFYDQALELDAACRPAKLNRLFALARLKKKEEHAIWAEELTNDKSLFPGSLAVIANSYIILGDTANADAYYEALKEVEGWATKADYYRSSFCYEHGFFKQAVDYARIALDKNPKDTTLIYHLSLCYSAVGEKDRALDMVSKLPDRPAWIDYYKFTLERDSGKHDEASQTLLDLPIDYFEDGEELDAAMEFARKQKDLGLLRHLRKRG